MLSMDAAAALLGISPQILDLWEEQFGYPKPTRTKGGEPLYPDEMMVALRDALDRELSICSAVSRAQGAGAPHAA
jgi:DNA-binding transcriptional MerR regulator